MIGGLTASVLVAEPVQAQAGTAGLFTSQTPVRLLDTRSTTKLGPGETRTIQVSGLAGVPAGAAGVSLNVTAVLPTENTFVTVWPADAARPTTVSNLNPAIGTIRPNAVLVGLSSTGAISLYNKIGSVDLVVDVNGWFSGGGSAASGGFVPVTPSRILDTRAAVGIATTTPVGSQQEIQLTVAGVAGVPAASGVTAVALNLTATAPTAPGWVTAWPATSAQPLTVSTLNFAAGETVPNLAIVPIGTDGKIKLFNSAGSTHLIADVFGYFTSGTAGVGGFVPVAPTRVIDTRNGLAPIRPKGWMPIKASNSPIPASGVAAVSTNITAVAVDADTWFTAFPTSAGSSSVTSVPAATLPFASNVNSVAGQIVPNATITAVGPEASFWLYNANGTGNAVVDVNGYWVGTTPIGNAPPLPAPGPGAGSYVQSSLSSSPSTKLFWDTCGPINIHVDTRNGAGHGLEEIPAAVDRIRRATGLPIVLSYDKQINTLDDVVPPVGAIPRDIDINFLSSTQTPVSFNPSSPISLTGSTLAVTQWFPYTSGEIPIALVTMRTDTGSISPGFGPRSTTGAILIHELGHAVGLSHATDGLQIMAPIINSGIDEFGAGDLTGLSLVKRDGCLLKSGPDGPLQPGAFIDATS